MADHLNYDRYQNVRGDRNGVILPRKGIEKPDQDEQGGDDQYLGELPKEDQNAADGAN
jgi:hypothetical protein